MYAEWENTIFYIYIDRNHDKIFFLKSLQIRMLMIMYIYANQSYSLIFRI